MVKTRGSTGRENIWIGGSPRFLRDICEYVFKKTFGNVAVAQVVSPDLPTLELPEHVGWLVWFLNSTAHPPLAWRKPKQFSHANVALIHSDGNALVYWADGGETTRHDISLQELVALVHMRRAKTVRAAPAAH